MSDTIPVTTKSQEYECPDFQVIAQSTKNINRAPFFKTEEMKSLQEKARRVVAYAQDLDAMLRDDIPALSVAIGNVGLSDTFATLQEIHVAMQPRSGGTAKRLFQGTTDSQGRVNVVFQVPENLNPDQTLIVETQSSLGSDTRMWTPRAPNRANSSM